MLALLIVVTLAADRLFALGLERLLLASEFRFSELYRGGRTAEVVVIGNSRSVHSFYAPVLAERSCRTVLHLGFNGVTPRAAALLLGDYVRLNAAPRLVVVEASMLFAQNRFLPQLAPYTGRSPALAAAIDDASDGLLPWRRVFHLYRFNSDLLFRALVYLGRTDQTWVNRGRRINDALIAGHDPSTIAENPVRPEAATAMDDLLDLAESEGFAVALVVAPYFHSFFEDEVSARFLAEFRAWLPTRFPRARLVDFAEFPLARDGFADPIHLNIDGARELTRALVERLPQLRACAEGTAPVTADRVGLHPPATSPDARAGDAAGGP